MALGRAASLLSAHVACCTAESTTVRAKNIPRCLGYGYSQARRPAVAAADAADDDDDDGDGTQFIRLLLTRLRFLRTYAILFHLCSW